MPWYKVDDHFNAEHTGIEKIKVAGKSICLVQLQREVYALSAICPHAGADLSKGWCTNGQLTCPYHRYAYDLTTGRGAAGQNDYINTYAVEVREDGVYVEVNSWLDKIKGLV
ncbi:Rieske (2Fe-2S) protein [Mucilaginibacter robiniae]|uniref:Rieske (2Fe-2S) protein n=1 Tax=Mucilaginibacter robiniae TaxID=2728022 RepID=A0A7L5ECL6_9SPHI|nr:Rieske (2Fe-2S) protein [Mucilaginibacter robiniae]QJD98166.1 Rieske (2Fe-2S) protein [Mucilaginibacter robiniae]